MQQVLGSLVIAVCALLSVTPRDTTYTSHALGKRYVVEITTDRLARAPKWESDADNPPVSARKAITLATALKDTLVTDTEDHKWQLARASLTPTEEGGNWYWLVDFETRYQKGGQTGRGHNLRLAVLLDGTVVKPIVKEDG